MFIEVLHNELLHFETNATSTNGKLGGNNEVDIGVKVLILQEFNDENIDHEILIQVNILMPRTIHCWTKQSVNDPSIWMSATNVH